MDYQKGDRLRWLRGRHRGATSEIVKVQQASIWFVNLVSKGSVGHTRHKRMVWKMSRDVVEAHTERL